MQQLRNECWKDVGKERLERINNLRNKGLPSKKRMSFEDFELRFKHIEIETNKAYFAVVFDGDDLVGMVMMRAFSDIDKRRLWLDHFSVDGGYAKNGVAWFVLKGVLDYANSIPHFKNKGKLYIRIAPSKEDNKLTNFLKKNGFELSREGVRDNDRHEYQRVIVV